MLIVKKFGGSSVANKDRIFNVAKRCIEDYRAGHDVVVVLSAMGDTTDELIALANTINPDAKKRELDMLLATGEQVSIALMASAFCAKGQPAVSFTGAQAGIKTNDKHSKASILDVQACQVKQALDEGKIVIVAGFQGITDLGQITTLGRGGSDTTAVAIAAGLKADMCDIYTDVDGVYTADPRIVLGAQKLDEITFVEMLELARLGAGVMQPRAVEYGEHNGVAIHVRSTFNDVPGTIIREEYTVQEKNFVIRGVAHDTNAVSYTHLTLPTKLEV